MLIIHKGLIKTIGVLGRMGFNRSCYLFVLVCKMILVGITVLLGLGAVISEVGRRSRPELTRWAGVAIYGLALLLLLLAWGQLPVTFVMAGWPFSPWQLDQATWWLSLGLILAMLSGGMLAPAGATPQFILLAGLIAIWAGTPAGVLASWALLTLLLWWANADPAGTITQLGLSWLALLALALAVATLPDPTLGQSLDMSHWPTIAIGFVLVAVLAFGGLSANLFGERFTRPEQWFVPVAAATTLFLHLLASYPAGEIGFNLPLTLLGLIGLWLAANRAWSAIDRPVAVVIALLGGQSSLLLLAGQWAGVEAALAEARVLLPAGAILLLLAHHGQPKQPWFAKIGPLIAVAAFAGLPLTAGFDGRVALYQAWFEQGRWLLPLIATLLQIPMVGAAFLLALSDKADKQSSPLTYLALTLPALALFSWGGFDQPSWLAWGLTLIPAGVGFTLSRFASQTREAQMLLQQAFKLPISFRPVGNNLKMVFDGFVIAMRESAAILEGEGGLLWVILLLVILWLAR